MFDYKGYTEETLQILCDEKYVDKGLSKWRFWPIEAYSMGRCLREYTGYPEWMTLYAYSSHGVTYGSTGYPHEMNKKARAMFVFNEEHQEIYRKRSSKPCYVITMPFVWYRRHKGYNQMADARGSLAFPAHSDAQSRAEFNIDEYIDSFAALPGDFHPVCVSLHMNDIHRGYHRKFLERGIPVYTAGHYEDIRFVDRFYRLLCRFKYTTSNCMGSYAYYSTEMGIPFSLVGKNDVVWVNESDPGLGQGEVFSSFCSDYYGNDMGTYYRKEMAVFSGLNTVISERQKDFVRHVMGIDRGLSREELRDVLWKCALSSKSRLVRDTGKAVIGALKRRLGRKRRHPLLEQVENS